jgi:hypothetical protein
MLFECKPTLFSFNLGFHGGQNYHSDLMDYDTVYLLSIYLLTGVSTTLSIVTLNRDER